MASEGVPPASKRGFFGCCVSTVAFTLADLIDEIDDADLDEEDALLPDDDDDTSFTTNLPRKLNKIKRVVRKEIREMPRPEQERFAKAVRKMMESKRDPNGKVVPGTSEYFRLASYHGGPASLFGEGRYCVHGGEAFPGWHRAYLLDFETTMRRADKALGQDGNIGLPYWDWARPEINGEVFPKILKEQLTEFPADFFPAGFETSYPRHSHLLRPGVLSDVTPDVMLKGQLERLGSMASKALLTDRHHRAVRDIEMPHNHVHGDVGGIMGAVNTAGFHPVFWLHHNNIDRFYEKSIQVHPDSHDELANEGNRRAADDALDEGTPEGPYGVYKPFTHPATGAEFHARDVFDIAALGYSYDKLPELPPDTSMNLTELPTFVCFEKVEMEKMNQSRTLFVYLVDKSKSAEWSAPDDPYDLSAGFAGTGTIFGKFPVSQCRNCQTRPPFDVTVDVTTTLRRLELRRRQVEVKVLVRGNEEPVPVLLPLDSVIADGIPIPAPVLRGPLFDAPGNIGVPAMLQPGEINDPDDVTALQEFLVKHGYKDSDIVDGDVGAITGKAIRKFQQASALKVDGVVGPKTKARLLAARFDDDKHIVAADDASMVLPPFAPSSTVLWTLGFVPGYLSREAVVSELQQAFLEWAASGLRFVFATQVPAIGSGAQAVRIEFSISHGLSASERKHVYDGPGGILAKTLAGKSVTFDGEEKWVLQSQLAQREAAAAAAGEVLTLRPKEFCLLPVAVHEIGHLIGLPHSDRPHDTMAPYYSADHTSLSHNDVAACQALYPEAGER